MGWISFADIYAMPTIYGAAIAGGLLFGVGFVVSGWCPGTAIAGAGSGKIDAMVFLGGMILGSIFFNESFASLRSLYNWGQSGVVYFYKSLDLSKTTLVLLFSFLAVALFWGVEYFERWKLGEGRYFNSPFLKTFSLALLVVAGGLFLLPAGKASSKAEKATPQVSAAPQTTRHVASTPGPHQEASEKKMLQGVEEGADHIEPEEVARRLMARDSSLILVDVRPRQEYDRFHIRGAIQIPTPLLAQKLLPYKNKKTIVLYSNGMTHPAQARDSLYRLGYRGVYILTDGLRGFIQRCLKPVSLRPQLLPPQASQQINAWRRYFLPSPAQSKAKNKK